MKICCWCTASYSSEQPESNNRPHQPGGNKTCAELFFFAAAQAACCFLPPPFCHHYNSTRKMMTDLSTTSLRLTVPSVCGATEAIAVIAAEAMSKVLLMVFTPAGACNSVQAMLLLYSDASWRSFGFCGGQLVVAGVVRERGNIDTSYVLRWERQADECRKWEGANAANKGNFSWSQSQMINQILGPDRNSIGWSPWCVFETTWSKSKIILVRLTQMAHNVVS